jgi:signal transduction histidine kinase
MKYQRAHLYKFDFEIRVYHLLRRQKQGVPVQQARDYLNQFGGVHIYDSGFHLPYYGPEEDWLHTELDHSHRLSASKLLPEDLQVSHGLNYLPTMSRLLGVVNVDTGAEAREATRSKANQEGKHLMIQITRDRLVDNDAFQNLVFAVRWARDFYAMQEAAREFEEKKAKAKTEPAKEKFERVEQAVEQFRDQIEGNAYNQLRKAVKEAVVLADEEEEERIRQSNLLGVLATAGMAAVAFRHEFTKQLTLLRTFIAQLRKLDVKDADAALKLRNIIEQLESWQQRVKANQSLFLGIANAENRETRFRPKAKELAESTGRQLEALLGNLPIDISKIDPDLRLPEGSFAEWSAILQNILINAANALLDSPKPKIEISSRSRGRTRELIIEDNGKSVDLSNSEELFRPFVRKLKLSRERQSMGMGGTGLGLTIVRLLAENLGCRVSFIEPQQGFKTALRIAWSEAHE